MEMEEKIQKLESEIEETAKKQSEMNEKYNGKLRELRKKIEEMRRQILLKNNEMIANAVRETYGEVSQDTLGIFKESLAALTSGKEEQLEEK